MTTHGYPIIDALILSCEISPILERQTRLHFAQTCRPVVATQADSAFIK